MSANVTSNLSKEMIEASVKQAQELKEKEFKLKKAHIEIQYEKLTKQQTELEAFKNFKLGSSEKRIESLKEQNKEYIELAKKGAVFLGINDFKGLIPLFPRNLILVGAETGSGKSTLTANLALQFLRQNKKVLVITNEEHPTDILNRVICLTQGWPYYDHTSITEEQQNKFDEMYPIISQRLEIIDDNYNGVGGLTTTIEGLETILRNLRQEQESQYDAILIDYYQNINASNKNMNVTPYEVQHQVGRALDIFKTTYNAPIILLSQLTAEKEEGSTPFKLRIEGRKSIYNFCTCAIEAKADKENSRTVWKFYKSRFAVAVGKEVITGFNKGRYVAYNREFAKKTEDYRMEQKMREIKKEDARKLEAIFGVKVEEGV